MNNDSYKHPFLWKYAFKIDSDHSKSNVWETAERRSANEESSYTLINLMSI